MASSTRSAFTSGRMQFATRARVARGSVRSSVRRAPVVCRAEYYPEWPNPEFIQETLSEFPEKGIASVEEARCLYSNGGYTYLDVRTTLENEEVGKVKDSVNVPFMNAKRVFNSEARTKDIVKSENPDFVATVQKRFTNRDSKLLVACNTGTNYTMQALIALDEAGYTNLVGLKGGYNAWFRKFDNKLGRRRYGEYAEDYMGEGSDSCGIHASGAGFEKVDAIEGYVPPSY